MKLFYGLLPVFLIVTASVAQTTYDFESQATSLTFQYFGSSLDPQLTTKIANPDKNGINTSENVGKFIKAAGAQVWAGGFANPAPASLIDAKAGSVICVKVWMNQPGNLALKLEAPEGGGETWITKQDYTTPKQWQELCFSVDAPSLEDSKLPAAGKIFGQIVLFFNFGSPGGSADETFYFDDIILPVGSVKTTTILDFEEPETSGEFSYFGSPIDGQKTEIIDNPNATGINTSARVSKYLKPAVAEVWAGAYSNPDPATPIDVTGGAQICIKVHMDHIGNLAMKLENSADGKPNWIQKVSNTKINEWEELCFDPTLPSLEGPFESANSVYSRIVLFFDFGSPGTGKDVTSYFDDVVVKSGAAQDDKKVSFKVNMNNFSGNFDKVYISGNFNGWSGDANPLTDEDLDGIWEGSITLPNGLYEYKVTLDNWAKQEQFAGTEECTKTTDVFTNRLLLVGGDTDLPEFCYNSCYACGDEAQITFKLGMGSVTPSPDGIWLAGGGNFDVPGGRYKMKDENNDGIYELTVPRKKGFTSYFTFTNGPCQDYSCKENLEGLSCANPSNFNDRLLPPVTANTIYASCFGLCTTNAECLSSVNEFGNQEPLFALESNPSSDGRLTLLFSSTYQTKRNIVVTNTAGLQVGGAACLPGQPSYAFESQTWPVGMYLVTVTSDKQQQTVRWMKY